MTSTHEQIEYQLEAMQTRKGLTSLQSDRLMHCHRPDIALVEESSFVSCASSNQAYWTHHESTQPTRITTLCDDPHFDRPSNTIKFEPSRMLLSQQPLPPISTLLAGLPPFHDDLAPLDHKLAVLPPLRMTSEVQQAFEWCAAPTW